MSAGGKGNFPLTFILSVKDEGVASKFNQTKSALTGTDQAAKPLNKTLANTEQGLKKSATSADNLGKKVQQSQQPIRQGSTAVADLGSESDKTSKKADGLAGKFQRNKGMIFGLTMLSSGVIEAAGMFSMFNDAQD